MVLYRDGKTPFQLLNACSLNKLKIDTRQVKKVKTRWVLTSLLCPHPFPTFALCNFFYSDCSWALSFTSGAEVSGESVFMQGGRKPTVSEKQLGKGAKYSLVSVGFPWISLWISLNWAGRVPIPVPSCLQGSKICFSTWETSVQSCWNGLPLPSMLDSQTLALIGTGSRISVSCSCRYSGTAGEYLICQKAPCRSDIFWNDAASGETLRLAGPLGCYDCCSPSEYDRHNLRSQCPSKAYKLHTWIFFILGSMLMSYPRIYNALISLGGSYV